MDKVSAKSLGEELPSRLKLISSLIARKPTEHTPQWARTVNEAFDFYTRTRTINLLHACNSCLIHANWPFPAYADLTAEIESGIDEIPQLTTKPMFRRFLCLKPNLITLAATMCQATEELPPDSIDRMAISFFRKYESEVFNLLTQKLKGSPLQTLGDDLSFIYKRRRWAACLCLGFPLLDSFIRSYFEADDLRVTVQVFRDAFFKHMNPTSWIIAPRDFDITNDSVSASITPELIDLRIVGVYLQSFLEMADRIYTFYDVTAPMSERSPVNRHAVVHGANPIFSQANTVRLISFIDLTIRLEDVLRILATGKTPSRLSPTPP